MASSQFISLLKVHEHLLNRPPTTETFEDRMIAQKIGYLSSKLGVYLGEFNWEWYKRGPYSRAFTKVVFESNSYRQDELLEISSKYSLQNEAKKSLQPLINIIKNRPVNLSEASWLELLASVLYIYSEFCTSVSDYFNILQERKPNKYSYSDFMNAWSSLKGEHFFEY
ncbi:hypothetical protein [Brevibacillus nitrificans]|uniref:hypothetical protein n=1 Tax=Brevibacillus nitrificans TaxID=651560 RepID=UPI002636F66D|nr:hypothetical protein [Brevibacillus nitrificans]